MSDKPNCMHINDAHLRALIEQAPVAIAMFDREMRYLAASRRWLVSVGADKRDVIGLSYYDVAPEMLERWQDVYQRALAGEMLNGDQDAFPRPDGRLQWMRWEAGPWRRDDGEIGGIVIYTEDVSTKVELDRALRASNAGRRDQWLDFNEVASRLLRVRDLHEGLDEILAATIKLLGAEMGNVQLLDAGRKALHIAAQRGFKQDFLEFFRKVSAEDEAACGRALRTGRLIVIEDVDVDESFAPFRSVARAAGFRAVVSAPLISRQDEPLGIVSAHFRSPHRPSEADLHRLDLYLHRAADFIERCRFEEALHESEERLRLAVEAGRMATWDWNVTTGKITWNDEHYPMMGYEIGEVEPSYAAWANRVHPDDRAAAEAALMEAMAGHKKYEHEFRSIQPDGTFRWCLAKGQFVYDGTGSATRMIGIAEDVTERRQWEETQRVLVAELQHRTRNLLAVVQSIAHQTMATAGTFGAFRTSFNERLNALSRVQSLLSHSDSKPITIGAVVGMEIEALGPARRDGRITLTGPEVELRNSAAQIFALAIHELATNARKYGALATDHGDLSVTWRINNAEDGPRSLVLEWVERGIARRLERSEPTRRGYGRTLIEQALPYTLSAKTRVEIGDDSVRCVIMLPCGEKGDKEVIG